MSPDTNAQQKRLLAWQMIRESSVHSIKEEQVRRHRLHRARDPKASGARLLDLGPCPNRWRAPDSAIHGLGPDAVRCIGWWCIACLSELLFNSNFLWSGMPLSKQLANWPSCS